MVRVGELRQHTVLAVGLIAALASTDREARALPGTHGPSISTWDTRASSVVLAGRQGFLEGGHFFMGSYNANFTSTSGNLSSQFGMHYLNFKSGEGETVAHGMSGTAVALFSIPATDRYENGIPKFAVGYFLGGAPAALVSGRKNYLSLPLVTGFALPWSPSTAVTITPWFEVSPGFNLDTVIHDISADPNVLLADYCDPQTGVCTLPESIDLQQDAVEYIVNEGVDVEFSTTVGARAGLDVAFHLSDGVDLRLAGMWGTLDTAFTGTRVLWAGASLVIRWDDIVPAVLPPEKRLLRESCEDVERRFRTCPQAERWQQRPGAAPTSLPPATFTPAAPPPAAPPPAAPPPPPAPPPAAPPPPPAPPPATPSPPPAPPPAAPAPAPAAPTLPPTAAPAPTPLPTPAPPDAPAM